MLEPLDVNWVILYFVYGQVFFILGLAIALLFAWTTLHRPGVGFP